MVAEEGVSGPLFTALKEDEEVVVVVVVGGGV
jgi:hypothetical protein